MNIGILPLIACIVSLVFGLVVLDQYFARRKPYQLLWAVGLFMYFVATFTEFWAEFYGVSVTIYRLWYLFGAIFVAAYLGMGTLYLVVRRRTGHIIMIVLGVLSVVAAVRVLSAPIEPNAVKALVRGVMPADVAAMAAVFNIFGTIALVGGALWSAWVFWRRRILPQRVVSNILIALGAILPAVAGTAMTLGSAQRPYVLELVGIIIIFIGFLRSREIFGLYRIPFSHGFHRLPEKT